MEKLEHGENGKKIRKVLEILAKEPFLGDDVIISVRGQEGKADFLGEKIIEFFEIYEKDENIDYILWLTPKYATAFSETGETLKPTIEDIAQIIGTGTTPISIEEIDKLVEELKRIKGAFIKEGGMILAGKNIEELVIVGKLLEKAAMINIEGKNLGGLKYIPDSEAIEQNKNYNEKYLSIKANLAKVKEEYLEKLKKENALRKEMVSIGRNLVKKELAVASWGNFSARLDEDHILVTPSGIPYSVLQEEDMVKIKLSTGWADGIHKPTSETPLHTEIYKTFPEAEAIVHGHGLYSSVFAGARRELPIVNRKQKEYVNGPVPVVTYAKFGTEKLAKETVKLLSKNQVKAAILAGHGTVNYGSSLRNALNGCIIIDECAREFLERKRQLY